MTNVFQSTDPQGPGPEVSRDMTDVNGQGYNPFAAGSGGLTTLSPSHYASLDVIEPETENNV